MFKNNKAIPLKHKIAGSIIAFLSFCYWIGVIAMFGENNTTNDYSVPMLFFVLIAIAFSSFAILFLSGIMARLRKRPVWHWILGIVLSIWAFACWGSITTIEEKETADLVILIIMGCIFTVFSILYLSGVIARLKYSNEPKSTNNPNARKKFAFENFDDIEEILYSIDCMEGHEFEYFCADLLRGNGFTDISVTQSSGDQGVDILATKDFIRYAIQCKNYSSHLGNAPIQEVNSGKTFYQCHVAAVITNSTFTVGAKDLAKATGVLLWDRSMLANFMKNAKR